MKAKGWMLRYEGKRYGVLAPSAVAAVKLAREVGFAERLLTSGGPLPSEYVRALREGRSILLELKTLQERALTRGLALRQIRAQTSSRNFDQPTSKELTMKKATKATKSTKTNGAKHASPDQKYSLNKKADYAVREGTMSAKFISALPSGKFTKAAAVSATQKAVKNEKRASLFFNYFKGEGVIATA